MIKTILKVFLLPLIILIVPVLVGIHSIRNGSISAVSIKKALQSSGVYTRALDSMQKSLLGFSVSDLESQSKNDPEAAAFAKNVTSVITKDYLQKKIESVVDGTQSWATGESKSTPTISFEDLKTQLLSKQKGNVDELTSFLADIKKSVPQEMMQQFTSGSDPEKPTESPMANPFDLESLIKKNPVIDLGPYLFWVKGLMVFLTVGWYISVGSLAVILLLILLLSSGLQGKIRWLGIMGISACIGLFLARYIVHDPMSTVAIVGQWLPKQFSDIAVAALGAIIVKPFLLFQKQIQYLLELLSLTSIGLVLVSYLDLKKPTEKKNILTLCVGSVLIATAYISIFPKAATLPYIGKYLGSSQLRVLTSSVSKTATVGKDGGAMDIVGTDGSVTLTIPKGSLLYKTSIKASTITAVSGLPASAEFLTGVDFKSQDAMLSKPAKLEIVLDSTPTKHLRGIAYSDGGKNLSIFPVTILGNTVIMPVMHFSGYGLITVPDTFTSNEHPNSVRDQAQQDMLGFFDWIQTTQAFGLNEQLTDAQKKGLLETLTDWWNRGVKPFLEPSLRDTKEIVPAAKEYTIWLQAIQALGFESQVSTQIKTSETILAKAILRAAGESSKLCTESHDPSQAGVLLKLYAIAEGLGLDGVGGLRVETLRKQALSCAKFKITITSRFTVEDKNVCSVGEDESYAGEIELTTDEDFTLSGTGTVVANSIAVCNTQCRIEQGDGPVTATVEIPGVLFGTSAEAKDISIPLVVTDETAVQYDCTYTVPGTDTEFGYHRPFGWDGSFYNMHDTERTGLFEYMITDWERSGNGDVFATKSYDWVKKPTFMGMGVPVHEVTTLKLLHTPSK